MDQLHYAEMKEKLGKSLEEDDLAHKRIFLFGHCEATLALADELERYGLKPEAILDNSDSKTGLEYRGIVVKKP